jgi:hypothetical protein
MTQCQHCNGQGWKRTSDMSAAPCSWCLRPRLVREFLGPDLVTANSLKSSPLYEALGDVNEVPTLDRTLENIFIKSRWPPLRPHLKLALGHRYWLDSKFRFRMETDERIFNVWIGKEDYRHRSRSVRDDATTFNGLRDLVLDPDLLILRLGHMGHPNKAAPGALKEALQLREVALKPTWVVQDPTGDYPHSWSVDVATYLSEHFDVVDFSHPGALASSAFTTPTPTMDVEEHHAPRPSRRTRSAPPPPTPDVDGSLGIAGAGDSKGYRGGVHKKRSSEGPV